MKHRLEELFSDTYCLIVLIELIIIAVVAAVALVVWG